MMRCKIIHNIQAVVIFLAVSVSFFFCFTSPLQAAVMLAYERLQPVTTNLDAPTAVALDVNERIYVTESSYNRLNVYSPSGEYLKTRSGLDKPIGVAVDSYGRIFVGNSNTGNVEVYDAEFTLLFKLGSGDGEFTKPCAIAIDIADNIYVADCEEDEINIYYPDGSYNFSFGSSGSGDGQFHFPSSIAIDEVSGEIIISDHPLKSGMLGSYQGVRIQVFDMNGVFKRSFGVRGTGEGKLIKPMGVAVDGDGRIYVTDSYQNVVEVFDSNGVYLGAVYNLDNPVRTPLGIARGNSNRLFIASHNASRVDVYILIDEIDADITVIPTSHDFGNVNVGSSSSAQTFTVFNTGDGDLVIDPITITGTDATAFSIQSDYCSGQTLLTSDSCTVDVIFSPTLEGAKSANLSIPSNDPDENPFEIPLSGMGSALPNAPPTADPNGPYSGIEGQAIILDGSGSSDSDGNIVLYEWDIDNDGTYDYSSSSPTQSHNYVQQGTYNIKLRVTDNLGATDEALTTANISDTSPTADFTGSPTNGLAPLTVNFTNNSTGYDQPLNYEWDFDNNGTIDSTTQHPSYIYNDVGTYTVKLTVTDSDGSTNTLTRIDYITVTSSVYTLTVNINGNGTVMSSPSGIDCGSDCSETFSVGTLVTLTATPDSGWDFSGWGGVCSSTGTCQVNMDSDKSITATFTEAQTIFYDDFNWDEKSGGWASKKIEETGEIVYSEESISRYEPAFSLIDIETQDMTIEVKGNDQGDSGKRKNFFIIFAYDEANETAYWAGARVGTDKWTIEARSINGSGTRLAYTSETIDTNRWYNLKVVVSGNTVAVYADNVEKVSYTFPGGIPIGRIGLGGQNNHAHFDDYSVTY